jgi:predicted permease
VNLFFRQPLVTLVAGFAGTLAFPGTHALVGIFGWRGTVLSFAAAIILIATPLIWSGCRFSERHAETHAVIANHGFFNISFMMTPAIYAQLNSA